MRAAERLSRAMLVFLSSPVKPGATHRLMPSREFEARLVEAQVLALYMAEAYERGRRLASGGLDARGVELGRLLKNSMVEAYEASGLQPLEGLHAAAIVVSAAAGYLGGGEHLASKLPSALSVLLYRSGPEASEDLLEGLESVGSRELVWRLSEEGISRSSVRFHSLALGDVFEKLSSVDSGFWLNMRQYHRVLKAASGLQGSKTVAEAAVKAYLALASEAGVKVSGGIKELIEADRALRRKGFPGDRLLGAALAASLIALERGYVERIV